jgi:hypothetical protein
LTRFERVFFRLLEMNGRLLVAFFLGKKIPG